MCSGSGAPGKWTTFGQREDRQQHSAEDSASGGARANAGPARAAAAPSTRAERLREVAGARQEEHGEQDAGDARPARRRRSGRKRAATSSRAAAPSVRRARRQHGPQRRRPEQRGERRAPAPAAGAAQRAADRRATSAAASASGARSRARGEQRRRCRHRAPADPQQLRAERLAEARPSAPSAPPGPPGRRLEPAASRERPTRSARQGRAERRPTIERAASEPWSSSCSPQATAGRDRAPSAAAVATQRERRAAGSDGAAQRRRAALARRAASRKGRSAWRAPDRQVEQPGRARSIASGTGRLREAGRGARPRGGGQARRAGRATVAPSGGSAQVGRELGERREHEAALAQPRVGQLEPGPGRRSSPTNSRSMSIVRGASRAPRGARPSARSMPSASSSRRLGAPCVEPRATVFR